MFHFALHFSLQVGQRVARCLSEYVWCSDAPYSTLKSALLLAKCLRAGLWEDSPYVSKQFEGVGLSYSTSLVHAGMTSISSIAAKNPREIEMIVNRPAPFGNRIKDSGMCRLTKIINFCFANFRTSLSLKQLLYSNHLNTGPVFERGFEKT